MSEKEYETKCKLCGKKCRMILNDGFPRRWRLYELHKRNDFLDKRHECLIEKGTYKEQKHKRAW